MPGQKDAYSTWWSLMNGAAGTGAAEQQFTSAVVTHSQRAQRSRQATRSVRPRAELRELIARRKAALAAGTLKAGALDPLDLRIIRDRLELRSLLHGPLLASAKVYLATNASVARVFGSSPPLFRGKAPVYEVVARFAYHDYAGRRHLGGAGPTSFDGASLEWNRSFGLFEPSEEPEPNFRLLGRPVALTF